MAGALSSLLTHELPTSSNVSDSLVNPQYTHALITNFSAEIQLMISSHLELSDVLNTRLSARNLQAFANTEFCKRFPSCPQKEAQIVKEISEDLSSAKEICKDDPRFKALIERRSLPRTQQSYYDFGQFLKICLREPKNALTKLTLEDLVALKLCTQEEMDKIPRPIEAFSEVKKQLILKNLAGFFISPRHIDLGSFFAVPDEYIKKGVWNTYLESKNSGTSQDTAESRASFALEKMGKSNMFPYAHIDEPSHIHPVASAVRALDIDGVKKLIELGMPLDELDGVKDGGALHTWAQLELIPETQAKIDDLFSLLNKAERGARNKQGTTPLHMAAAGNHIKQAKLLLEGLPCAQRTELLQHKDIKGTVPIWSAALGSHLGMITFLLEDMTSEQCLEIMYQKNTEIGMTFYQYVLGAGTDEMIALVLDKMTIYQNLKLPLWLAIHNLKNLF